MVGQHHVSLPVGHQLKRLGQRGSGHPGDRYLKTVDHVFKKTLLHSALQVRHTLALQVQNGFDFQVRPLVHLRPAVQGRLGAKAEQWRAFRRQGHIGHQVDVATLHGLQTGLPFARHGFDLPATRTRQLAGHLAEYAIRQPIGSHEDFGRVVVHPHANGGAVDRWLLRPYTHGQQAHQPPPQTDGGNV